MSGVDGRLFLFFVFLKIGALSFGGAYTIWGMTELEFLQNATEMQAVFNRVIPEDVFFNYIEIGRMTPGPNISGVLLVGHYYAGLSGIALSLLGIMLPSTVIMILFYHINQRWGHLKEFRWFKDGALTAVISVLVYFTIKMAERAPKTDTKQLLAFWFLAAFSFILIHTQKTNVILVTLFCGLVTWCFQWV